MEVFHGPRLINPGDCHELKEPKAGWLALSVFNNTCGSRSPSICRIDESKNNVLEELAVSYNRLWWRSTRRKSPNNSCTFGIEQQAPCWQYKGTLHSSQLPCKDVWAVIGGGNSNSLVLHLSCTIIHSKTFSVFAIPTVGNQWKVSGFFLVLVHYELELLEVSNSILVSRAKL